MTTPEIVQYTMPVEWPIVGGIAISIITFSLTRFFTVKNYVRTCDCEERRKSDKELVDEKFHRFEDKLDIILDHVTKG